MKDEHDDGHGFGFKAVLQPRYRFVRSAEPTAEAEAGYGGLGYGGLGYGGFGGLYGGLGGLYGGGYKHSYYGHGWVNVERVSKMISLINVICRYGGYGGFHGGHHKYYGGHSYGYGKRSADEPSEEAERRIADPEAEADAKAGFGFGGLGYGGLGYGGFGGLYGGLGGYGYGEEQDGVDL